jgi:hypothetical protein
MRARAPADRLGRTTGRVAHVERYTDADLRPPVPVPPWGPTMQHGELVYGLVVAVDIENFGRVDTLGQLLLQTRLSQVLYLAASKANLDRERWYRQLRGDGELAVLPPDIDVAWVVAGFTECLNVALDQLRAARRHEPRLRLRMAMHHGTMTAGDFGPAGSAPIIACRLLDARVTRAALRTEATSGDLVLVISEQLYRDVVQTRFHGLAPERFRPIRTSAKGVTYAGYLCAGTPRVVTRQGLLIPDIRPASRPHLAAG